jgi:hypothetical protein
MLRAEFKHVGSFLAQNMRCIKCKIETLIMEIDMKTLKKNQGSLLAQL